MRKKYLFFDIDGTLTATDELHSFPKDTLITLGLLKAAGHFVAIATGRAHCMAVDAMHKTGITAMVCDGGNGLVMGNTVLKIDPMDRRQCLKLISELEARRVPYGVMDGDKLEYHTKSQAFVDRAGAAVGSFMRGHVDPYFDARQVKSFHKIFVACHAGEEKNIPALKNMFSMRFHEDAIVVEPGDKFKGIKDMMNFLKAPLEDVVVFGDGANDLDMFSKAPFKIAMGNAVPELKAIADYVTADSDKGGIMQACQHFGWI